MLPSALAFIHESVGVPVSVMLVSAVVAVSLVLQPMHDFPSARSGIAYVPLVGWFLAL